MKRTIFAVRVLLLLITVALPFSFAACSGGIDRETADAFIEDFFAEIKKDHYGRAETFFHPDQFTDIEKYLKTVEEEKGLDFSNGITVERRSNIQIAYYDSEVGGSRYGVTLDAKVGDTEVTIVVVIVQSENGYGVYEFAIN